MKKIYICDFDDSFTFNILSEIQLMGMSAEVIPLKNMRIFFDSALKRNDKFCIILGPGPGHPSEYLFLQDHILEVLNKKNVFTMGICLGHQLIWYYQGAEV